MARARERAAVGFTVKSGWAYAVPVAGSAAGPRLVDTCRVEIGASDELKRLVGSVKRFGSARRVLQAIASMYTAATAEPRRRTWCRCWRA